MPVAPAEVTAEFTIRPTAEEEMEAHVKAGVDAARASGLAVEVGPQRTGLSGSKADVLDALARVMDAAIEAGARSIEIKVEAPEVTD